MRRPFLRIPGSPQAIATVETPAQYAPTLLLQFGSSFRRWWLGMSEPIMSICSEERVQNYTKKFDLDLIKC